MTFDPGESTGWAYYEIHEGVPATLTVGTVPKDLTKMWHLLHNFPQPDVFVIEEFRLFPSHSKALVGNTFYPCEVIGVLKLYAMLHKITVVTQAAHAKKYSGASTKDALWVAASGTPGEFTRHAYDAYIHLCYYLRYKK
jgi:hypothetical protein